MVPDSPGTAARGRVRVGTAIIIGILLDGAGNQAAGGGRMKCVEAGRKTSENFRAGAASVAVTSAGVVATVATLNPPCAVTQIEQPWWDAVEFSAWACTACTTPIAHTRAIESMHTTLVNRLRSAVVLTIFLECCRFRAVALDDSIVKPLSTHTIRVTRSFPGVSFQESYRPAGWSVTAETPCNSLIIRVLLL